MAKFKFRSDTVALKGWLAKRKKSLEEARLPFESVWKDIRLHIEPSLGKALVEGDPNDRAAQREDERIYNSEPRILLQRMAAGLQSGITNQSRQWFKLETREARLGKASRTRAWLDFATEAVQGVMQRSNVYSALDQLYSQLGQFGTAAGLVVYDADATVHLHVCDMGSFWLAQNRRQRVDTLLRKSDFTLQQLIDEFGEGWVPTRLIERKDQSGALERHHVVWNLVCPVAHFGKSLKDVASWRAFASVYWIEGEGGQDGNDGILAIRSYGYNPVIAPRWSLGASVYGTGCGYIGLADSKELQRLEKDKLKLVEQEADPSMLADSSMKGVPINTGPGGVTYGNLGGGSDGRKVPVQRLFQTQGQIQAVLLAIQSVEDRLRRVFYSDLFSLLINLNTNPTQKTATEVNELSAEKVALLGPVLTRLNTDLLDPLVDAVFTAAVDEAIENGGADVLSSMHSLASPPPDLAGQELKIEYVSSLHVEQQAATRLTGLSRLLEFVGGIAQVQPDVVDKLDTDKMIDVAADSLVEHGCVRDQKEVDAVRQARAQQQQAMMQAEQAANAGKAVKDVAQAGKSAQEMRSVAEGGAA